MNFRYYIAEIEKALKEFNSLDEKFKSIIERLSELKTSLEGCWKITVGLFDYHREDSYDVAEWIGE